MTAEALDRYQDARQGVPPEARKAGAGDEPAKETEVEDEQDELEEGDGS